MAALVLGGAKSGKSRFAENLVTGSGAGSFIYIATAEAGDAEMAGRIAEHRRRRGARWLTVEEPMNVSRVIGERPSAHSATLVDCLTLWLSNLMAAGRDLAQEAEALCAILPESPGYTVLVSNEIGFGLVPESRLGREFRDAQGALNQRVAAACDTVVLVVAGLPVVLKGTLPK